MGEKGENRLRRLSHALFVGDRMINFRPFFLLSLGFGLGIFCCFYLGLHALWLNVLLLPAAAFILLFCKKRRAAALLFSCLVFALFSLGSLSFAMRIAAFERVPAPEGHCVVRGVVEEAGRTEKTDVFTFGSLTVVCEDGTRFETDHRMQVYVYGEAGIAPLSVGSVAVFEAEPQTYDAYSYGRINSTAVIERVRYRAFVGAEEFYVVEEGGADLFSAVRERIEGVLFESMDEESAALSYAMLTGNSGFLEEDLLQNFRYGGIAHIFAVSGLHIGIIAGLLYAIFKKLRVRPYIGLPVIALFLVLYSGVCGFSPSSLRAVVMCLVPMLASALGRECDRLNSVSVAALVVLLIHPVYLFSVGFQLSLAAAAGIILVGGNLSRLLSRVRFVPRKISSALSVAFSAQLCTFPILIDAFGYTSGLSLLLNLLFIPVISAVFSVLFACTAAACLIPAAAGWLLYLPAYLLQIAVLPITLIEFDVLLICGFSFGGIAALWFALCWLLTDKINLRPVLRCAACIALCAAVTACMLLRNLPIGYEAVMTVHSYYGSNLLLLRGGEETFLICAGAPDEEHVETVFLKEGIEALDGVIVLAAPRDVNTAVPVLLGCASFDTVFVPASAGFPEDVFKTVEVSEESGFFYLGGMPACFAGENALYLNICGAGTVISASAEEGLPRCDVLLAPAQSEVYSACSASCEIYFEKAEGNLSVYSAGDLQIGWKNGIISVERAG